MGKRVSRKMLHHLKNIAAALEMINSSIDLIKYECNKLYNEMNGKERKGRMKKTAVMVAAILSLCVSAFGMNIQDNFLFTYSIVDASGDHVTGQAPTVKIMKASNGYWYDFSDGSFKASGWGTKSTALSEDATEGYYYYHFNPPASETAAEQYLFVVDNSDALYGDHQSMSVDYQDIGTSDFVSTSNAVIVGTNNDKTGYALSTAGVDAVWDELLSGHTVSGSAGAGVTSAAAAGDPWDIDISTGYTGKAGAILRAVGDATDGNKESGVYSGIETLIRTQR